MPREMIVRVRYKSPVCKVNTKNFQTLNVIEDWHVQEISVNESAFKELAYGILIESENSHKVIPHQHIIEINFYS
jgi:hypothetical protein